MVGGGRTAEEEKSIYSRFNSNYYTCMYILVLDSVRREITYQEMVSERWEVLAAVLVCLLGEEAEGQRRCVVVGRV